MSPCIAPVDQDSRQGHHLTSCKSVRAASLTSTVMSSASTVKDSGATLLPSSAKLAQALPVPSLALHGLLKPRTISPEPSARTFERTFERHISWSSAECSETVYTSSDSDSEEPRKAPMSDQEKRGNDVKIGMFTFQSSHGHEEGAMKEGLVCHEFGNRRKPSPTRQPLSSSMPRRSPTSSSRNLTTTKVTGPNTRSTKIAGIKFSGSHGHEEGAMQEDVPSYDIKLGCSIM